MFLSKQRYKRILSPAPVISLSLLVIKISIIATMIFLIANVESEIIQAFAYIPIIMVMVHLILEVLPNKISKKDIKQLLKEGVHTLGNIDKFEYVGFRGITHFVHYSFKDNNNKEHHNQCVIPKRKLNKFGLSEGDKIDVLYIEDKPEINAAILEDFAKVLKSVRK